MAETVVGIRRRSNLSRTNFGNMKRTALRSVIMLFLVAFLHQLVQEDLASSAASAPPLTMVSAFTSSVPKPSFSTQLRSSSLHAQSRRERNHELDRRRRRFRFLNKSSTQASDESNMDVEDYRQSRQILTDLDYDEEEGESLIVEGQQSRRTFFARGIPLCAAASTLCGAGAPANAASKDPYVAFAYKDKVKAAFQDIKDELSTELPFKEMGTGAGVPYLEGLINDSKWDEVKEFTKFYDSEFRKAKLGYVRKILMSEKEQKEKATLLSNAVTFDLIGINRAARKTDQNEAYRYLTELKDDIETFLKFESQLLKAAK